MIIQKQKISNTEELKDLTEKLKAIAHPLRLAIIQVLSEYNELTVTQIYQKLNSSQAVTSQQLILLKSKGILSSRKSAKNIYYSIDKESVTFLLNQLSSKIRI